ncbi:type VI secretion system lipoprotein TssJ [Cognatiyoonia sp. IB215182]|uniref:type VI secretion system lipoprotein TssJ n=1 Tax=Cognatiyoonia sp. IB215182 TaxID=3097353 RepID=UPI002A13D297|nr:type VI secretion system lipoprotein TssJ [Cognatiyoonia sp. IB215182]MDX8352700.1 type VI secretion system lipoprotein TssJ [Cognatiyoonia sp. IB215182]
MILTRRYFILSGTSAAALAACGDAGPGTISVAASMAAGANPGPDGSDRPLTLSFFSLNAQDAFDAADVLALQDPETALGGTLLRADQLALAPGGAGTLDIPVPVGATTLGVIAGFRDVSGKTFRTTTAIPASGDLSLTIAVSPTGLALS